MSTRLATDSRPAITVRQRARVDITLLATATAAVSAFGLIGQHENPVGLAISLAVGAVGGWLISRGVRRRISVQKHTCAGYTIRSAIRIIVVVIAVTLAERALGATDGVLAGLIVGTIVERVRFYRSLDA